MAGKRHHTIPQFLLRGFASSQRGDKTKVWQYRKGKEGIELNTANVAVEQYFYGKPEETDLDEQITRLEEDFAPLVDSLRDAAPGSKPLADDRIPFLVAHLAFRTRHVRESVSSTMGSFLAELGKHLSQTDIGTALFAKELATEGNVREGFKKLLLHNGVLPENLDDVMQQLEPEWQQVAANMMSMVSDEYQALITEQLNAYEAIRQEATKGGFIDSMSRNLTLQGIVDSYAGYNWFTCSAPTPLLLADSACIFETNGARRFTAMDVGKREELQRIYLPLASQTLLVGVKAPMSPTIDWSLLNKATARCSYEFFISSRQLPADSHFIKGQGLWAGVFDKKEFHEMINDVTQGLS